MWVTPDLPIRTARTGGALSPRAVHERRDDVLEDHAVGDARAMVCTSTVAGIRACLLVLRFRQPPARTLRCEQEFSTHGARQVPRRCSDVENTRATRGVGHGRAGWNSAYSGADRAALTVRRYRSSVCMTFQAYCTPLTWHTSSP